MWFSGNFPSARFLANPIMAPSIKISLFLLSFLCVYVNVCYLFVHHIHALACGDQKKALEPLELDLQITMSLLVWVLGTEPGSSKRTTNALNEPSLQSPVLFYNTTRRN